MSDIPEALGVALADRYELERVVGRGGMATVYLAHDLKHGREVALKVLRPDLAASIGTDRFLVEIEIAARLTHPHIVPLHDSGEAEGFLYYVMPFVEGKSLRALLNRERQIELATAVSITVQVADALSYAHRMGVLHRDIKPENILLSGRHAFVTDFGIAKALSSAAGPKLTRSGFPLGTVGYMSPEQAAGVRDIDVRSDVYGLACVLYEMLVGDTPGLWLTEEAVRLGRLVDAEANHRTQLDKLPGRVEQVLARGLAMRPTDRYPTPTGFADALVAVLGTTDVKFREIQVQQIIGRAAQLQAESPLDEDAFSLGTLEQVAAEVGIPAERVREAVEQLGGPATPENLVQVGPPPRSNVGFSDSEVRQIIQRAVELEAMYSGEQAALTVGGLELVAAEVDIPPERVHEAIAELRRVRDHAAVAATAPGSWRPAAVVVDRTIGHEITESEFVLMLEEIRSALGARGRMTNLGRALTWSTEPRYAGDRDVQVVMTPSTDGTQIRVEERLRILGREIGGSIAGWAIGGLIGIAVALGFGAVETSILPLFGISFSAAGAYVAHRSIFENTVLQRRRQLEELADRLVTRVRRAASGRERSAFSLQPPAVSGQPASSMSPDRD